MSQHTPTPYQFSDRNWRGKIDPVNFYICGNCSDECMDDDEQIGEDKLEPVRSCTAVAVVTGNATADVIPRGTAAFLCRGGREL